VNGEQYRSVKAKRLSGHEQLFPKDPQFNFYFQRDVCVTFASLSCERNKVYYTFDIRIADVRFCRFIFHPEGADDIFRKVSALTSAWKIFVSVTP